MIIESMCVACHGPVPLKARMTAIVCGENCHGVWRRIKRGKPLHPKYHALRAMHAHRRELEAVHGAIERLFIWHARAAVPAAGVCA